MDAPQAPLLWHIPISHYNEKARWALDYKKVPHRRRPIGPDYLFQAWRKTGQGKLPILFLDGVAVWDSTRIIETLERRFPEPALYPADPAQRARALALEDFFDEQLGPQLRAAVVTPLFRHDPDLALRFLTTGMPPQAYRMMRPMTRVFPAFYRMRHNISEAQLESDRAMVVAALDRMERERRPSGYLVGDAFSVADLTAAALLGPAVLPPELQYPLQVEIPACLRDWRDTLLQHPAVRWAKEIYRKHRGTSAEIPRAAAAA